MNLYFIVEGKRTESIIYPAWLSILIPELERIYDPFNVKNNQYYLFDGGGYPNILKDMVNSIYDINEIGKFDYFIVCLDSDDESVSERIDQVKNKLVEEGVVPSCKIVVIVQRKCIETWFLGNRSMYMRKSKGQFRKFSEFYNVAMNDPELMEKPNDFEESTAQYHYRYLEAMLKENGLKYSKRKPYCICQESYVSSLIDRINTSDDLMTLRNFISFCNMVRKEIKLRKNLT